MALPERVLSKQQWMEDLDFSLAKLKEIHANRYLKISEEEFAQVVNKARVQIENSTSDLDCYMALRQVIASIQDAHTILYFNGKINYLSRALPIKVDYMADGFFIGGVDNQHKDLLRAKIIAINEIPIDEIATKILAITSHDNKYWGYELVKQMLRFPSILKGIGINSPEDSFTFSLLTQDGKNKNQSFEYDGSIKDADLFTVESLLGNELPLYVKDQQKYYWFEHLKDNKLIYAKINRVDYPQKGEQSFNQFTTGLFEYFDKNSADIEKLVLDLRNNSGGNGRLSIPFIKELIKREPFFTKGKLFVLIGSKTNSAGIVFATQLLEYTNALFVGSPSGCAANMFSNSVFVGKLPNSGYSLEVSSRLIENTWIPNRSFFKIDIPIPITGKDYYSGIDPVLDAITKNEATPLEDLAADKGAEVAYTYYRKIENKYPDLSWWNTSESLESSLNNKAYALIGQGLIHKAIQLFILNTRIFSSSANAFDSLGEAYMLADNKELAIKNYEKSLELNPKNNNAEEQLKKLKQN